MKSFDLRWGASNVVVEITPLDPADATCARVRYYVEREGAPVYVSREDAVAIASIERLAWEEAIRDAIDLVDGSR